MTTDFRALCIELVDIITAHANPDDCAVGYVAGVLIRARFALADGPAVPQSPAEGEVAKLVQHLHHAAEVDGWNGASPEWCQSMLRAAELLQRQEPVPVPEQEVSE